jgi:hypothetical protein
MNGNSKPILFADDTNIIVSDPNPVTFKNSLLFSFEQLNVWVNANLLSLNFNKTQYIQFKTTNSITMQIDTSYNNKHIANNTHTKFLGITVASSLSWKNHIDGLMRKLSNAIYSIRVVRPFVSQKALRMIYFSYFPTILTYGIIFWGNSSYSNNIFKLQKKVIRIMMNARNRDSCRELFRELNILPLFS